jgi:hypothetical protein
VLKHRRSGGVELGCDVIDNTRWYPGRLIQKGAKKTNRTQLKRKIEAITCRTQSLDVTKIDVIEMEISGELFAFGFAVVAAILTAVLLAKESDGHLSTPVRLMECIMMSRLSCRPKS